MNLFCSAIKMIFATLLVLSAKNLSAQSPHQPLRQTAPGIFQVGAVQLNKEKRTIHFPATINMTNGPVEYFVVNGTGKLHESVLRTEIDPSQIHVAMLLLGVRVQTNFVGTNIVGDKFIMEVSWKNGETETRTRAENLVINSKTKSPLNKEGWIYNGSKEVDGTFIAQRDGSIVSIITDPLALANSLQPDRDNDDIWSVNTNTIPPLNTAVEVTFQLERPQISTEGTK